MRQLKPMNPTNRDDLERIVDRYSVAQVVQALCDICHEKADHLATNWQDHAAAARWQDKARKLDRIVEPLTLSW